MWYTRQGDSGTTYLCDTAPGKRIGKHEARLEALGTIDELNSYIGYCRALAADMAEHTICLAVQHDLFIIQAQLAGIKKKLSANRLPAIEQIVNSIEHNLPPIKSFCVPGQTMLSACYDVARALVRRAERNVSAAAAAGEIALPTITHAYLNRLSSLFYALARQANHRAGVAEISPKY